MERENKTSRIRVRVEGFVLFSRPEVPITIETKVNLNYIRAKVKNAASGVVWGQRDFPPRKALGK